ncbi:hypothetical protein Ahy_B03g066061 [Arachis hypogaea]|uniref:Uncharacterized protein n=1 Tax=Arachis hypogaea TaxID=3818 RepID=A0A445A386_ARAHY|nr:hypothetical protein Ahy_B03g066061 [Arachis hypogaea]
MKREEDNLPRQGNEPAPMSSNDSSEISNGTTATTTSPHVLWRMLVVTGAGGEDAGGCKGEGDAERESACTQSRLYQDHSKLDSSIMATHIEPMITIDSSIKSNFNYTPTYRKAWLGKQHALEKNYNNWGSCYQELPVWLGALCKVDKGARVEFEVVETYNGNEVIPNVCLFLCFGLLAQKLLKHAVEDTAEVHVDGDGHGSKNWFRRKPIPFAVRLNI